MTERLLVLIALAVAALLLAGAFFGARSYLRLLAAVSAGRRLAMLPALIALAALAPLAASLGWAPGFGVSIALWLFSALAYCLAILTALVCWQGPMRWLGRAFAATFALPGLGLAFGFLRDPAGLLVLLLVLPGMRQHTSASGRISPTLTYETGTSHSLWGDTPYETFEIYRNVRWLPPLRKRVGNGATDCQPGHVSFSAGRDDNSVLMTCAWPGGPGQTTEVKLGN